MPIDYKGINIGRGASNSIHLQDESVSRYHSEIVQKTGKFYILDLGSTSGTFIKIYKREIKVDEIYEIGSMELRVLKVNIASKKPLKNEKKIPKKPKKF